MNNIMELIQNHRSIRSYSDRKVEQELMEELITVAQMASTSSFIQAYSVIQVNDDTKRKQLAHYSGDQTYVYDAPQFLVFCADLYRLKQVALSQGKEPDFSTIESLLLTSVDTALFAQNFMIAAESKGLGGVYIGGIRSNPKGVSEVLELPELVFPLFGMCIGYPKKDIPDKKKRLPLHAVLHQDTYQKDQSELINSYDEEIKEYYVRRTNGLREETWSSQMAKRFNKPLRPDFKLFLNEKGLKLD